MLEAAAHQLTRAARVGEVDAGLLSGVEDVGVLGALDGLGACGDAGGC